MCNCETQLLTDQKPSITIFPRCALVTSPLISAIWFFRPYKPYIFWKLMTSTIQWIVSTDPLTTHPSPTQTHQAHHVAFWVSHSLLCLVAFTLSRTAEQWVGLFWFGYVIVYGPRGLGLGLRLKICNNRGYKQSKIEIATVNTDWTVDTSSFEQERTLLNTASSTRFLLFWTGDNLSE